MTQKHLIEKQLIQLEIDSSKDAYAIQQKMSQLIKKEFSAALNDLFNNLVPENQIIKLDTVEVDIGTINNTQWNTTEIVDNIIKKLKNIITKKITQVESINDSDIHSESQSGINIPFNNIKKLAITSGLNTNHKNSHINSTKEDEELKNYLQFSNSKQSIKNHHFKLWLYWLEKGTLPPYTLPPGKSWMENVFETLAIDYFAITALKNCLTKKPIALQRLALQHSAKHLQSVVELFTGYSQKELLVFLKEINTLHSAKKTETAYPLLVRDFEIQFWKTVFTITIIKYKKLDCIALIKETIKQLIASSNSKKIISFFKIIEILEVIKNNQTISNYSILRTIFNSNSLSKLIEESITKYKEAITHQKENHSIEEIINTKKSKIDKINTHNIIEEVVLESPQFFNNAGIVLLNPFITTFFNKLNLLDDNNFKNFNTKSKAVLLLHYLATGNTPKDYDLVLPKFLCNMPTNKPIDFTLKITEEEKKEANNLLEIVIQHWGVLGSTSPDGLRDGFLARQGKLEKEQTGWKLYVEQKTLDILLDKLPWNISIIKLPWMSDFLKTEWR